MAALPLPAQQADPKPKRTLIWLPVVPRRIGHGPRLLLALLTDSPISVSFAEIGSALGVSTKTAGRWRDVLLADGVVRKGDTVSSLFLELDGDRLAELRHEAGDGLTTSVFRPEPSAIPRFLLSRPMSAAAKVACAELLGERAGFRKMRWFDRSNDERASRADVSPTTVRQARRELQRLGLLRVERVPIPHTARYYVRVIPTGRRLSRQVDKSDPLPQRLPTEVSVQPEPESLRDLVGTSPGGLRRIGPWKAPEGPDSYRPTWKVFFQKPGKLEDYAKHRDAVMTGSLLRELGFFEQVPRVRNRWAHKLAQRGVSAAEVAHIALDVYSDPNVRNVNGVLQGRFRRLLDDGDDVLTRGVRPIEVLRGLRSGSNRSDTTVARPGGTTSEALALVDAGTKPIDACRQTGVSTGELSQAMIRQRQEKT